MNPLTPNATFLYLLKTSYVFKGYKNVTLNVHRLNEVRNFVSSDLGFSTLRRNLRENCLSLKNKMLNSILTIKISVPVLWEALNNATETIIIQYIKKYYAQKKWRWEPRSLIISNDSQKYVCASTVPREKVVCKT